MIFCYAKRNYNYYYAPLATADDPDKIFQQSLIMWTCMRNSESTMSDGQMSVEFLMQIFAPNSRRSKTQFHDMSGCTMAKWSGVFPYMSWKTTTRRMNNFEKRLERIRDLHRVVVLRTEQNYRKGGLRINKTFTAFCFIVY